jgi:hypothetical protein
MARTVCARASAMQIHFACGPCWRAGATGARARNTIHFPAVRAGKRLIARVRRRPMLPAARNTFHRSTRADLKCNFRRSRRAGPPLRNGCPPRDLRFPAPRERADSFHAGRKGEINETYLGRLYGAQRDLPRWQRRRARKVPKAIGPMVFMISRRGPEKRAFAQPARGMPFCTTGFLAGACDDSVAARSPMVFTGVSLWKS